MVDICPGRKPFKESERKNKNPDLLLLFYGELIPMKSVQRIKKWDNMGGTGSTWFGIEVITCDSGDNVIKWVESEQARDTHFLKLMESLRDYLEYEMAMSSPVTHIYYGDVNQ